MAFQYVKLALAGAMMAAPAIAAPLPQEATVTRMVYVDQNGNVVEGPASQAAPTSTAAAASSNVVQAAAVKPTSSAAKASSSAAKQTSAAASSAAPKSSAAATSASGGSSGGNKKGLVYAKNTAALAQATQIAASSNGAISWMYDWEGYPFINGQGSNGYEVGGVEFVPMLHTNSPMFIDAWKGVNPGPQGKGAKHALFINEPDYASSSVDPQTAASLWTSTFAPNAQGALLGGPATTGSTGGPWIKQFLSACSGCKIDFHAYHYYADSTDVTELQNAIKSYHDIVQKPLWITEFGLKAVKDGGNFSAQQRADFIEAASKWMDQQDYIERYAPYQVATDGSVDELTTSSPITKEYISA